jgi:hypothetical protein
MNLAAVDKIAKAMLYEGYVLYPYRASAVKNRQRFNFGVLYPRAYSQAQGDLEPYLSQMKCLVAGNPNSRIEVRVRFLHLVDRALFQLDGQSRFAVARMEVDGHIYQTWEEAAEQEISLPITSLESLLATPLEWRADIEGSQSEEVIRNSRGEAVGIIVRTRQALHLLVEVNAQIISDGVFRLSIRVNNLTEMADSAVTREKTLLRSAVSSHTILGVEDGKFVSLLEPPEDLRAAVESCKNIGGFPVLLGARGQHDTLLASPIILYDYPEIAAESAGDLFDSTEIDEILSLRIMTLTDEEKREVRGSDERARRILERTEALPQEQLMKLHGALRGLRHVRAGEEVAP